MDEMTIGAFARACGLTAGAVRFYADAGVIAPARVDAATGYRFYRPSQVPAGVRVRLLRELGVPLGSVRRILADPAAAPALVEAHVQDVENQARVVRELAAQVLAGAVLPVLRGTLQLPGGALAAGLEAVLSAVDPDSDVAVLAGVHLEAGPDEVRLTGTDRYRLAVRTLVPLRSGPSWSATLAADPLRALIPWLRRRHRVTVDAPNHDHSDSAVGFDRLFGVITMTGQDGVRRCPVVDGAYPDTRGLVAALPEPGTRVTVARDGVLLALERSSSRHARLAIAGDRLTVGHTRLAAETTGPELTLHVDVTSWHPAIVGAAGREAVLEFIDAASPVRIRSADTGDLLTLAMPVRES